MVNHEKEDKGVCIRCGNRLSGSYDNRPSVVVCLRKSAFPDGEVFYFWEFKDKDDKKIILDLQDSWRMTQELEFALDKLVVNPYPLSDSPSMRAKRFLDYLMDQPTSIPESDIRINKSLVEKEYNNLNLSKTKDN